MELINLIILSKTFTESLFTEILDPNNYHSRDIIVFTNS